MDCVLGMKMLGENSIDSIVTDPPYGLSFMGKKWDYDVPAVEVWAECLRILKPGGYLLSFGGTRTYHRLATRIEDAGFTLHPMLGWLFGSGFPKATRVELPNMDGWRYGLQSLKPAIEPICFAQKPFSEATGTANIVRWGTGALNIDACRVETTDNLNGGAYAEMGGRSISGSLSASGMNVPGKTVGTGFVQPDGRWPANLIHDGSDEVLAVFPQSGGQQGALSGAESSSKTANTFGEFAGRTPSEPRGDTGSAARFFYCAKASKKDRNDGCEDLPLKTGGMVSNTSGQHITRRDGGAPGPTANNHPTVKPTDLMRYLCRLITPAGGIVLDPFAGSGSTGKAAKLEGFDFFGFEKDPSYAAIANARIDAAVKSKENAK